MAESSWQQSGGGTWDGNSMPAPPSLSSYMGGSPGDGFNAHQQQPSTASSWNSPAPPPTMQPQQYPPRGSMMPPQPSAAANFSPGSITQYASQQQQRQQHQESYAGNASAVDPAMQQQQQYPTMATSSNSYAARSAQAYATTGARIPQQQPQYLQAPPATTTTTMAASSATVASDHMGSVATATTAVTPGPPQDRILNDCTRRVQEHAYYMRMAMEQDDLPTVLDRAAHMIGELGEPHGSFAHQSPAAIGSSSSLLTPKSYYELHIRALEEMPNLEEYLFNKAQPPSTSPSSQPTYSMLQLYEFVQFCPQVLSRLYLQICVGSALIRSQQVGAKWVLNEITAVTKCVQNPTRGLFLRHFLLQALRDKLPDQSEDTPLTIAGDSAGASPMMQTGNVKDAYEFVLANFVEMNKLWVRLQHLPGEGKSKEQRKRRERERNDLRVLVGMNLVRLSQLEGATSRIYGEVILPEILGQIVACGDPLAQAYLMDCIIQVFPDEYHIETLPILLTVCPKLRDKVNIRTILQSLMDRLSNYYAEEELLDENDSNQVKKSLARDSLPLFEECVQNVYNARGPKLTSKEVIRLQTALINFSLKSCPGNITQIDHCLSVCVAALGQASQSYAAPPEGTVADLTTAGQLQQQPRVVLDEVAATELDKLLTLNIVSLALQVLELRYFPVLMSLLPWRNRRVVGVAMLRSAVQSSVSPRSVPEAEELWNIIAPSLGSSAAGFIGASPQQQPIGGGDNTSGDSESILVAKFVHLLRHPDVNIAYELLMTARNHLASGGEPRRIHRGLVALVFSALQVVDQLCAGAGAVEESSVAVATHDTAATEGTCTVATTEPEKTEPEKTAAEVDTTEENADSTSVPPEAEEEFKVAEEDNTVPRDVADFEKPEEVNTHISSASPELSISNNVVTNNVEKALVFRKLFILCQQAISMVATGNPETAFQLYVQAALSGHRLTCPSQQKPCIDQATFEPIAFELLSQALALYDSSLTDVRAQIRCIVALVGCLLSCRSLSRHSYDTLVTKTAQLAARTHKRQDQCQMVALCSHLFFPVADCNPQRALECLQRALKLADACTASNPSDLRLFVDLLDHYIYFFENNNPAISDVYIVGLISLIREHLESAGAGPYASVIVDSKEQFLEVLRYIKRKKDDQLTAEHFSSIQVDF